MTCFLQFDFFCNHRNERNFPFFTLQGFDKSNNNDNENNKIQNPSNERNKPQNHRKDKEDETLFGMELNKLAVFFEEQGNNADKPQIADST